MENTLSIVDYIHELKEAGFSDKQAEVQARKLEQIIANVRAEIKEDIKSQELATRGDIREIELHLQKEIKSLEVKILYLYGAGFITLVGILAKGFHWI